MKIEIHHHHYHHHEGQQDILSRLIHLEERLMTALTDLQTEVAENTSVVQSAIVLIQGLKTKLDEAIASGDPAALVALSAELDTNANQLAEAVAANTPSEEPPPPVEDPAAGRSRRR